MTQGMTAYESHLRSPLWSRIKGDAAARSLGLCELCKSAAKETHHIKYPRGYANDGAQNVLHVCSACHRRLHGMTELVTDRALVEIRVETFKNRQATVWVDERRWVWAPWETWARVLVIPAGIQTRLFSGIQVLATMQAREWGEPFSMPHPDGSLWFRWHVIDDQLTKWVHRLDDRTGRGNADRVLKQSQITEDESLLRANVSAIKKWGRDLQERALGGALTTTQSPALPSAPQTMDRLQQAMLLLAGVGQDHEVRLTRIEKLTAGKDPQEFILAESLVIEQGLSPRTHVPGTRVLLPNWLGRRLTEIGAARGPRVEMRLEGSAITVAANKWRRCDLLAALNGMPKD